MAMDVIIAAPQASASVDTATKEVKKMAVAVPDDIGHMETEAEKAARIEEVKKTMEMINQEEPRWVAGMAMWQVSLAARRRDRLCCMLFARQAGLVSTAFERAW
jgi:hypothetical protein